MKKTNLKIMFEIEKAFRKFKADGGNQTEFAEKIGISQPLLNDAINYRKASRDTIDLMFKYLEKQNKGIPA